MVAVVLSGSLDDGTTGHAVVKVRGGLAVVQAPEEALYPSMPRSAMLAVDVDHVLTASAIANLLVSLAGPPATPPTGSKPMTFESALKREVGFDELDPTAIHGAEHPGTPSGFGRPDCGGALWELSEVTSTRYRCRVGHAWTAGALLARQADALESAFWTALRALGGTRRALSENGRAIQPRGQFVLSQPTRGSGRGRSAFEAPR